LKNNGWNNIYKHSTIFNQIDKRWVDKYVDMWNIPLNIENALKLFTGEIKPSKTGLKDKRRIYFDEMDIKTQKEIIKFFTKNKILILSDIIKGNDEFSASWKSNNAKKEWRCWKKYCEYVEI